MKAQVVYEHDENFDMHSGPYGYTKVGVLIEDRVIWLALLYDSDGQDDFRKWKGIANKIVSALNGEVTDEA